MKKIIFILISLFICLVLQAQKPPVKYNYAVTYKDSVKSEMIVAEDSMCINNVWFTTDDFGSSGSFGDFDSLRINGLIIDSIYSISDTLFFVTDSGTYKMGRELANEFDSTGLSGRIVRDSARIDSIELVCDSIKNSLDTINFDTIYLYSKLDTMQNTIDSIVQVLYDAIDIGSVEFDSLNAIKLKTDTLKLGTFYFLQDVDSLWLESPIGIWLVRLDNITGGGSTFDTTYIYGVIDSLKNFSYIDTTITLLDNTTGGNINIGQVGYSYKWEYEMTRGANWRTGDLRASAYSTTVIYDKGTYIETSVLGVTINSFNISSGQIRINYTTTNTGSNVTMVLKLISKL